MGFFRTPQMASVSHRTYGQLPAPDFQRSMTSVPIRYVRSSLLGLFLPMAPEAPREKSVLSVRSKNVSTLGNTTTSSAEPSAKVGGVLLVAAGYPASAPLLWTESAN